MSMTSKNTMLVVIAVLLVIAGVFYFFTTSNFFTNDTDAPVATTTAPTEQPTATSTEPATTTVAVRGATSTIGTSADGNAITAYHFGTGEKELLFVGGIHGGYSWSTALVAYELVDYLAKNPTLVPEDVMVTVIPVLNPDGLKAVVGTTERFTANQVSTDEAKRIAGRFNDNNVDINRNFDCEWNAKGTWQSREVSGGSAPFSEPESQAIKNYVEMYPPTAVVAWYSAAGGVYASNCQNGVLPETTSLVNTYAQASGYKAYNEFNYYEITGDMVNWFAKLNIPAISVLLSAHNNTEWTKNKAGIDAMLKAYAE
jgi:murein tripeptide amidase MpaA